MLMAIQILDALFLFGIVGCALVMLAEDENYRSFWPRLGLIVMGAAMFAQAMWLLGVWIPGMTGYPIPRLTADGAIFFLGIHRVIHLVRVSSAARRSSTHLNRIR